MQRESPSSGSLQGIEGTWPARDDRDAEEQNIAILKEAEAAPTVGEVIRRHGITPHTYYRWNLKFAGMEVGDARHALRRS